MQGVTYGLKDRKASPTKGCLVVLDTVAEDSEDMEQANWSAVDHRDPAVTSRHSDTLELIIACKLHSSCVFADDELQFLLFCFAATGLFLVTFLRSRGQREVNSPAFQSWGADLASQQDQL